MSNLLTTIELASHYKVSRQAVDFWRKDAKFPVKILGARTFRYDLAEVEQYFKNKGKK